MKQGTVRRRFSVFALAQLLWSAACFFVFCWVELDTLPLVACAMLGYLPLGWASARWTGWGRPDVGTGLGAVLLPAGIAWAWAGTTAVLLFGTAAPAAVSAAALLGLPALVLASPSLLLVVYMMDQMAWSLPNGGGARFGLWLAGAILLAGLLPPLLFFLGSLLGAGRTEENSVSGS